MYFSDATCAYLLIRSTEKVSEQQKFLRDAFDALKHCLNEFHTDLLMINTESMAMNIWNEVFAVQSYSTLVHVDYTQLKQLQKKLDRLLTKKVVALHPVTFTSSIISFN